MKLELKKMILHDFKGIHDAEYDFKTLTKISGRNASGKSTIATAFYWVFADRDYNLKSNPPVQPLDMEESLPSVTVVADIDGTEITIRKYQVCKKSEPDDNGVVKVAMTNKYEVNAVPVAERDFVKRLNEYGLDKEKILPLSHPAVFTSQKAADMRKILFDMVSEKTDLDIALMDEDTKEVAELLKNYKAEEIQAMSKATKKKADEAVKSIPDQIVGLENAKVDGDLSALKAQCDNLEQHLAELNESVAKENEKSNKERAFAVIDLDKKILAIEHEAKAKADNAKSKAVRAVEDLNRTVSDIKTKIDALKRGIASDTADIDRAMRQKERLKDEWRRIKAQTFREIQLPDPIDENTMVCPTCGQKLPDAMKQQKIVEYQNRVATIKAKYKKEGAEWQAAKNKNLREIGEEGKQLVSHIETLEKEIEQKKVDIDGLEYDLKKAEDALVSAKAATLKDFTVDLGKDTDYQMMVARSAQLKQEMNEYANKANDKDEEISRTESEIKALRDQMALIRGNDEIDRKIEALQNDRMEYEQKKANAEMILDQLSIVSKRKNEILVEEINAHFDVVKFILFDFYKNGEYKEVCIPTIDGKRFGESLNTGREIVGRIDICASLQRFYDCKLPIFLDNAESLNAFNIPSVDTQLILLTVTEDEVVKVA